MKRRAKIRSASFLLAAFAALFAWGLGATLTARSCKAQLNVVQQRALTELNTYLDGIETALRKSVYADAGTMLSVLSAELRTDAAGAKTSLSALSAGESTLSNLYKFLSQVGEYTESLHKKAAKGEKITEEERQTLKKLLDLSARLSEQFHYMNGLLDSGYFSFEELREELKKTDANSENTVSFITAVNDAEESMTDFPALIYDGPFSDNILNKTSALLENAPETSLSDARRTAAQALDVRETDLLSEGVTEGKLASYCFRYDKYRVAVTRNGGRVAYILSDVGAGEEKLTGGDAVQKASAFLNKLGYTGMVSTYFASTDGVCTVNFAYKQDGYVCYPDLIKVSVSLSDGRITAMDAADYLMNHVARTIPAPAVDEATARAAADALQEIRSVRMAVIPTGSGGERCAYELLCRDGDQDVLVYADTQTGDQADILLLLYADGGTLTK